MHEVKAVAPAPRQGSMRAMRLTAIGVFVVAALWAEGSAQAQDRHGPGGPGGPGMMLFGGPPEHVGRAVDHMLDGLNASEAQRSQIKQIAMAASTDIKAQRDAGRGLREKGFQIFAAPSVDAGAAESVRQQLGALYDQGSKRMLQAMLDVSKVLTPEQRAKLGERMKERQAAMQDRMQRMQTERPQQGPRQAPPK